MSPAAADKLILLLL